MFVLDERLKNDTIHIANFALSEVLLSRDANYTWLILVPRKQGLTELHQLDESDYQQFCRESVGVARLLAQDFDADKMNVAALGNIVSQLHIHHIVVSSCTIR